MLDDPGDWREKHPGLKGGGWAFQFSNPYYPDLDDSAMVVRALHRSGSERYRLTEGGDRPDELHIRRAIHWLKEKQRPDGDGVKNATPTFIRRDPGKVMKARLSRRRGPCLV